jgi:hypothetical protein
MDRFICAGSKNETHFASAFKTGAREGWHYLTTFNPNHFQSLDRAGHFLGLQHSN